ncbi:hypothetical protein C8T65DRAFT_654329 [Cerioporus squamosus]|nr:hypothetical protein C8T65DRAFT_654329 [Cerioporus squamosus]
MSFIILVLPLNIYAALSNPPSPAGSETVSCSSGRDFSPDLPYSSIFPRTCRRIDQASPSAVVQAGRLRLLRQRIGKQAHSRASDWNHPQDGVFKNTHRLNRS